jgi:hypothetical protein
MYASNNISNLHTEYLTICFAYKCCIHPLAILLPGTLIQNITLALSTPCPDHMNSKRDERGREGGGGGGAGAIYR